MKQRNLVIKKQEAYVWRVYLWGSEASHNHIPCWYVVDADTGEVVKGGYDAGNNCRSGSALLPRRKDAKAFIDGYKAQYAPCDNPHKSVLTQGYLRRRPKGSDEETEAWWDEGREWVDRRTGNLRKFSQIR